MIVLAGGDVVAPGDVYEGGSVLIDAGRIVSIEQRRVAPDGAVIVDASKCFVVPGFIDVHVHGVDGSDALDGAGAVARIAAALPRYGVTSFCPTSVACGPEDLAVFLDDIRQLRSSAPDGAARVLPAHLESNFINPDFRGAQPLRCLRSADEHEGAVAWPFTGAEILELIERLRAEVGIVTLAPELPGAIDLIGRLVAAGHTVSMGHSGADFDVAIAAIEAGARHATHLFNRMPPMTHRAPGLVGAVLSRHEVAVELICDGYHVHPAVCDIAISSKGPSQTLAITDGTAGSGQAVGSSALLGGRVIQVREEAAFLEDGTLAGSTLTMDRAFRNLVTLCNRSVSDASAMCAASPAAQLRLADRGRLQEGLLADVVLLDREFHVVRTYVDGVQAWPTPQDSAAG